MKNLFTYIGAGNQKLHGYERRYKHHQLRKRGFRTRGDAESHLRQAMDDIDAVERGEVRTKPTTCQAALNIYRRKLEIRSKDKGYQYAHNVRSNCKVVQEFVNKFGPDRLVREVTETDLREFYQTLSFRVSRNSAGAHMGRVQGMLKAAQEAKPDLVNWLKPTLTVRRKTKFERRVVEPWEYATLVKILLNPPLAPSRRKERKALWRDAGDVVQLLRMTGGRLNEILRMTLDQFEWDRGTVLLHASKTENERRVPLVAPITELVQARIRDGLTGETLLFKRAKVLTYDNAIGRACIKAAKIAKLNYGQANGFTCHSLRHTFITDLMIKTGGDAGTVMSYSGHRSLESFSTYLHASEKGCNLAIQALENVALFLRCFEGREGQKGHQGLETEPRKPLQNQEIAV
ncbi:MAG: tyrosine-type recombinase/integrase [Pyrinomonadaceae bacterium]